MRIVSAIDRPLADEHVLGVDPPLRPELPGVWRRRINPFTGRALSDRALTAEQDAQSGIQRLRGQCVTAGIHAGLDLLLELDAVGAPPDKARLQLLPGSGLAQSGEDVVISLPRSLALADLPVRARVDILDAIAADRPPPSAPADDRPADPGTLPGGALAGLNPLLPRRIAKPPLGELIAKAAASALPRVAVLVAQPVTATILAAPRDRCAPDPRDDPYDDLQLIDGVRLVLDFWPDEMTASHGGASYALPAAGPAWRNRLAYGVFGVERGMLPGELHPWEQLGLPLALVAFNPDWTLAFVDRGSVTRLGGRPSPRTPLVPQSGNPVLWQARLAQFTEHLAELPDFSAATLAGALRLLPPVGFLPISVLDLASRRQNFFPAGLALSLAPIPLEQVDLAVAESASLLPINLNVADEVELLVPVPERLYEPGLLEIAGVDPAFARAITRAVSQRTEALVRREAVRRRRDLLVDAASGSRPSWPTADSSADEVLPDGAARGPVGATRVRQLTSPAGAGPGVLGFIHAGTSLDFDKGDVAFVWVRIVDAAGLTGLALSFGSGTGANTPDFSRIVFWGAVDALPRIPADKAALLRRGDLPPPGVWTRLEVSADETWNPDGEPLAGVVADAINLIQRGGTVQWGPLGKVSAGGFETVWVADDAPPGALLFSSADPEGGSWPQVEAGDAAGLDPAEEPLGTAEAGGIRSAAPLVAFRSRWPQPFLAGEFVELDEGGIDGFVTATEARLRATNDAIDLGFVRARADIYRVRQYMLGADAASRLVTSPSLADLAVREESARAKSLDIAAFLKTAYHTDFARDPGAPLDLRPARTAGAAPPAPPPPSPPPAGGGRGSTNLLATNFNLLVASSVTGVRTRSRVSPALAVRAQPAAAAAAPAAVGPVFVAAPVTTLASDRIGFRQPDSPLISLAKLRADRAGVLRGVSILDVQAATPLPGTVERTASVAERLAPAPVVEAHNYAIAGKLAALTAIAGLIGTGDAAGSRPPGIALGDLPCPGFRFPKPDPVALQPPAAPPRNTIADVIADLAKPPASRVYADLDELQDAGPNAARHEADYFTASVRAIDNTIALMRLVEARIDLYNTLLGDARAVRDELMGHVSEADARLRAIGIELEEARQDFGVATALLAEERARVEALNARRAEILAANAQVVLFRRPRRARRVRPIVTAPASAALETPPIVACNREHIATPEEIHAYVGLMRDAPVTWFPNLHPELERIDRLEVARAALAAVHQRATLPPLVLAATQAAASSSPRFLRSVRQVMIAQRSVLENRRQAALQLDLGAIQQANLINARRVLLERAALADLIAGDHNRATVARAAADEIEHIGKAAACLHDSFGDSPPIVRLQWAELLSEFDAPAPLRDLNGLIGWSDLPIELRKTQQGLVDWLFGRIDPTIQAALTAINELIRICLLMAAHAPIDRLIPARLVAPAPARVGGRLSLFADAAVARVGMTALIRDASARMIAHAVVEDIEDGVAHTRIVKTFAGGDTIGASALIELSDLRLAL